MSEAMHTAARAARRAYELGRMRAAALRAIAISCAIAIVDRVSGGAPTAAWIAAIAIAWALVDWRGGALRAGGVRGLLAGVVVLLLPMAWLRPCCSPGMALGEAACCAEPNNCLLAGGVVGVLAAITLPAARGARRLESAIGVSIVTAAIAYARCRALVAGEIAGLALGLVAGVAAAGAARACIAALRAESRS